MSNFGEKILYIMEETFLQRILHMFIQAEDYILSTNFGVGNMWNEGGEKVLSFYIISF